MTYKVTVQMVITGTLTVEADSLGDAFDYADEHRDDFVFDPEDSFVNWSDMSANEDPFADGMPDDNTEMWTALELQSRKDNYDWRG